MEKLNRRSEEVLGDIVDLYTASGAPVGSKALAERSRKPLSAATIRNVMADLEAQGLLSSPHTSAGRIPTEQGFRYFATSIVEVSDLDYRAKKTLSNQISTGENVNNIIKNIPQILGDMTSCAGLVSSPRWDADPLDQVEFVRLNGDRVLVVMVTQNGNVENRIISVPQEIDEKVLNNAAHHLNDIVGGQTLSDARVAMMANLTEQKGEVNAMMNQMMDAAEMWTEPTVTDGALVVAGSNNLFQYPELVRDKLKDLFKAFEEKRLLMALMNEMQKGEGVQIFIGSDCPLEAAKTDCAMITAPYSSADQQIIGTLGVIGPMRMDYRKTIGIVDYTAKLLSKALELSQRADQAKKDEKND